MTNSEPAERPGRRAVTVGGTRATVIDMHAHCAIPEATALAGRKPHWDTPGLTDLSARLDAMDAQGIDIEALSINPFWYGLDGTLAGDITDLQNRKLAEFCGKMPERFAGLATLALQQPELAARQLAAAVTDLGLRGAMIGGSVNGAELSDPRFHPFWAQAEELGCVIFIHPQGTPELAGRLAGNGVLGNVIGNPLETTIALSHLIFEGTLDRFPGLRILAAHGGGYLPSYAARSDIGGKVFPAQFTPLRREPTEYLRDLYYDTIVFTAEALRHLVAEVGASRLVLGTDYPYPWTSTAVEHVLDAPGLTDPERVAILGGTARDLLGLA